jgi:hypothetical protein
MEKSTLMSNPKDKLFDLLKTDISIPDPHVHFRVGIVCDEDVVTRRELFGANHIEKPEHDWIDLTSTVVVHHPIIWLHICKFDVLITAFSAFSNVFFFT